MRNGLKIKGFTLIELVIVMTLVGILVAIALPQFQNLAPTARTNVKNSTVGAVKSAFSIYVATNNGSLPSVSALAASTTPAGTVVTPFSGVTYTDDAGTPFVVNTFKVGCGTATTAAADLVTCVSGHTP